MKTTPSCSNVDGAMKPSQRQRAVRSFVIARRRRAARTQPTDLMGELALRQLGDRRHNEV